MDYQLFTDVYEVTISATSNALLPDDFFEVLSEQLEKLYRAGLIDKSGIGEHEAFGIYVLFLWDIRRHG